MENLGVSTVTLGKFYLISATWQSLQGIAKGVLSSPRPTAREARPPLHRLWIRPDRQYHQQGCVRLMVCCGAGSARA